MRASIADVAKYAEVSISTVSRVINRRELVNKDTRARVEAAIRKLGYRPNGFARGLMLGRSEMVGLVLPDLHGEFYSEIIRGADRQAHEMGYGLVVSSLRAADDAGSLQRLVEERSLLDGVALMIAELTDETRAALERLPLPFVLLDTDVAGAPHDSVVIDQRYGAARLIDHVVRVRGARRFVFVGGLETNVDTIARLEACRDALRAAGLTLSDADVHHLDYQYETAFELARESVAGWRGADTCVFAANDEMAAGVIAAANAAGLSLPADLAVVGFDDTRIARMTHPPLTTVRVPMALMGGEAVRLLAERLTQPDRAPTHVTLQPEVIVRASAAPVGG